MINPVKIKVAEPQIWAIDLTQFECYQKNMQENNHTIPHKNSIDHVESVEHFWASIEAFQDMREFYSSLSEDELSRMHQYRFRKDKIRFLIVRGILRKLLGFYMKSNPTDISFSYNEHGKPQLQNDLCFSVSYSQSLALICFSAKQEVGVDIEKIQFIQDFLEIAERFFSKVEYDFLNNAEDDLKLKTFFQLWTQKEAFIKAIGQGLFYPLDQFTVPICLSNLHSSSGSASCSSSGSTAKHINFLPKNSDVEQRYTLQTIQILPEYEAALAVQGSYDNLIIRNFSEELGYE